MGAIFLMNILNLFVIQKNVQTKEKENFKFNSKKEEIESYRKVINDVIEGLMHSILVMVDGVKSKEELNVPSYLFKNIFLYKRKM